MILMDMPRASLRAHTPDWTPASDVVQSPRPVRRDYARGEQVFRAAATVTPCLIVSGALRIDRPGAEPDDLQLALPGDLIGLEALHGWAPACHVRAVIDSVITPLRRMSDPEWRDVLLNALLRRQAQGTCLARLRAGNASERVRRLLLRLGGVGDEGQPTATDRDAPILCDLPSLSDMSAITACAPETVSRVMSSLRRAGLITDVGTRQVQLANGLMHGAGELPGGMTRSRTMT
jgi:CRP-like cAMP-binding protein